MDEKGRRELLEAVARGELSPEEATARLGGGRTEGSAGAGADEGTAPARRVRIEARGAWVRVVPDDAVATLEVEGDHRLDRDDDLATVRIPPRRRDGGGHGNWVLARAWHGDDALSGPHVEEPVIVRVPPHLDVTIQARSSRLEVEGIRGLLTLRLAACSAKVRDLSSPFSVDVRSTHLLLRGRLDGGDSTIGCRSSRVRLELDPSSDVRVEPRSRRVLVRPPRGHRLDRTGAVTLGSGSARVAIDGSSSVVDVRTRSAERVGRR